MLRTVCALAQSGKVLAAYTPGYGGAAEALFKMGLGNRIGFALDEGDVYKRQEDNKVSLFVRYIDLKTGKTADRIVNRYEKVTGGDKA